MTEPASAAHGTRARQLGLGLAAALTLALAVHFDVWRCPVAELFALPCPGCGLSRAALALAAGDVRRAAALHPLSPVIVPWLALVAAGALARRLRGELDKAGSRATPLDRLVRAATWAAPLLVALLLGVWFARFFGAFGGPVPVSSHLLG